MPDVFLVRHQIAPGKTEEARELFARLDDPPEGAMDVLDAETVYTESAFLETGPDGDAILYYIEAEDGATVYDVFQDLMDAPEDVAPEMAAFVEQFESVVTGEPTVVDVELLYHVVNPDRPAEP